VPARSWADPFASLAAERQQRAKLQGARRSAIVTTATWIFWLTLSIRIKSMEHDRHATTRR